MANDDPKRAPPPAGGRGAAVVAGGCALPPCPGGETGPDLPLHLRASAKCLEAARVRAAWVAVLTRAIDDGRRAVTMLEAVEPGGADEVAAAQVVADAAAAVRLATANVQQAHNDLAHAHALECAALVAHADAFPPARPALA